MDTWQYFMHRYFHQNAFLYRHIHSPHQFSGFNRIKKILFFPSLPKQDIPVSCCTTVHGSYLSISLIFSKFKFELLPNQRLPPDFAKTLTLRMKEPLMCKVRFRT